MQCSTKPIIFYFKLLIMCTFCQLWPSGDCVIFNFYCHWSSLVLRNRSGVASFLHSKEGVTQGDPLDMFTYSIGILLLKKSESRISWRQPDLVRVWSKFARVKSYFNLLKLHGPGRGYYPKPSKSVLVVHLENIKAGNTLIASWV